MQSTFTAAMTFVSLEDEPEMFRELGALFHDPRSRGSFSEISLSLALEVHKVGSFVASYVPTRADFYRLDKQFRVPDVLFEAVPHYADYGFAVFQLTPTATTVHPMAFTFPTRSPDRLFFPTVHIHDGSFHERAAFDHTLYYQHPRSAAGGRLNGDQISYGKVDRDYARLAERGRRVVRRMLSGMLPNQDTWIAAL